MNSKFSKILKLVTGLIGLIGFYYFIRIMMIGDDVLETDAELQGSVLSPFVSFATYLLIATAVIAVVFSMINLFKHPQVLKRSLLGVGILAIILVIAYVGASDAAVTNSMGDILKDGEAGTVSKWVSTLINFSFYLGAIGLVFFFLDFAKSLVK
jgi:glucan phosphoethanolaminetransferase (alkaline phosphatase superfamily)